jgi:hypothetical protein
MPLSDIISRHDKQTRLNAERAAESRRQTRIGRYRERFQQAFGDLDDFDIQVDAPGNPEPAVATGTLMHNNHTYQLVAKRSDLGGIWWYLNGEPLFRHIGSRSNTGQNISVLVSHLQSGARNQTTDLQD